MQNLKLVRNLRNFVSHWQNKARQAFLFLLTGLMAAPAFAGSDTTFSTTVDWVNDKLTGSMGALIAIIALVIASSSPCWPSCCCWPRWRCFREGRACGFRVYRYVRMKKRHSLCTDRYGDPSAMERVDSRMPARQITAGQAPVAPADSRRLSVIMPQRMLPASSGAEGRDPFQITDDARTVIDVI